MHTALIAPLAHLRQIFTALTGVALIFHQGLLLMMGEFDHCAKPSPVYPKSTNVAESGPDQRQQPQISPAPKTGSVSTREDGYTNSSASLLTLMPSNSRTG